MLADIVAVAGDPLSDIRATAALYLVVADGQVLFERLDEVRRPGRIASAATVPFASPPQETVN